MTVSTKPTDRLVKLSRFAYALYAVRATASTSAAAAALSRTVEPALTMPTLIAEPLLTLKVNSLPCAAFNAFCTASSALASPINPHALMNATASATIRLRHEIRVIGLAIWFNPLGRARGPKEERAEYEIRCRAHGDLCGHDSRNRIRHGESEEAKFADSTDDNQWSDHGGLSCEPKVHAAKQRNHKADLSREEWRERNWKQRRWSADGHRGENDHADGVDGDGGPQRTA